MIQAGSDGCPGHHQLSCLHLPQGWWCRKWGRSGGSQGDSHKQQMGLLGSSGHWAGGCGHVQSLVSRAGHVSEQVTATNTQGLRSLCPHIHFCYLILGGTWVSSPLGLTEPPFQRTAFCSYGPAWFG